MTKCLFQEGLVRVEIKTDEVIGDKNIITDLWHYILLEDIVAVRGLASSSSGYIAYHTKENAHRIKEWLEKHGVQVKNKK